MAPAPARALPRSRHPVVQLGGAAARRDPVLLLGAVRLHPGHHRVPRGGAPAHEVPTGRASTRRATVHRTVATVHRTFANLSRPSIVVAAPRKLIHSPEPPIGWPDAAQRGRSGAP